MVRNLTHVEGMSLEALRAGIRWDFESYPEYLAALERGGLVPNVASFVGHSSVRTYVLGEEASKRKATDAEIAEMRRIVVEALRVGAIGFATSTLEQHNGEHDEDEVKRLLRHPHAAVALSDAGAHLSFLCDAGFGLHLFGHWARERGDLSLEQAVRAVTSAVADAYRIQDRGRLRPGAWADLMLFDPRTVGRGPKRRVNDLPTGASRLDTPAVGLHGVWVNGVRTLSERGIIADCGRPGRLLREFAV